MAEAYTNWFECYNKRLDPFGDPFGARLNVNPASLIVDTV
jgi:hypothetical protein